MLGTVAREIIIAGRIRYTLPLLVVLLVPVCVSRFRRVFVTIAGATASDERYAEVKKFWNRLFLVAIIIFVAAVLASYRNLINVWLSPEAYVASRLIN